MTLSGVAMIESKLPRTSSVRRFSASDPLDLVNLGPLIERTTGRPEIVIGLIDGPVVIDHPDFVGVNIRGVHGKCALPNSIACRHGTFVAGILSARRGSVAPAICPSCALLVCPIFSETPSANELIPSATPEELAAAIIKCVDSGARLLNLSAALEWAANVRRFPYFTRLGTQLHRRTTSGLGSW